MLEAITPVAQGAATSALGALDGQAFLTLMIAQMRYQDPLAPTDTNAMMEQTAVLAQTEMIQQLVTSQQQVLGLQFASIGSSLLGTEVTARLGDGTTLTGVVDGVRFTATGPQLLIDGQEVPLGAATELHGRSD